LEFFVMKARFIQEGRSVDYTAISDVEAGTVIVTGYLIGVAIHDIPAGQTGALQTTGIFDVVKVPGEGSISRGDKIYWNVLENAATRSIASGGETPISFPYLGKSVAGSADSDTTVRVIFEQ
jgi:predicted RecA/RadA family phage recombinase